MPETAQSEDAPLIEEARLLAMIEALEPKEDVYTGIKFFKLLLQSRGVKGVMDFLNKAKKALDDGDGLDLTYDFDTIERSIFNRSRPNLLSRRGFLRTIAWQIPGTVYLGEGILGALDNVARMDTQAGTPAHNNSNEPSNGFAMAKDALGATDFITDTLIGGALVYEGHENKLEMKLEQIADAVSALDMRLRAKSAGKD
jgi:hypothetical protein